MVEGAEGVGHDIFIFLAGIFSICFAGAWPFSFIGVLFFFTSFLHFPIVTTGGLYLLWCWCMGPFRVGRVGVRRIYSLVF